MFIIIYQCKTKEFFLFTLLGYKEEKLTKNFNLAALKVWMFRTENISKQTQAVSFNFLNM